MIKKWSCRLLLVVGLWLLVASVVQAGGWSVLTLNELPQNVVAGEPFTIQFVVRQHGRDKLSGLEGRITAVHPETYENLYFDFRDTGEKSVYEATMTLPEPGMWQWKIDAFGMHTMPPLTVAESTAVPLTSTALSNDRSVFASFAPWQLAGMVALVGGFVMLIVGWRRPSPFLQGTAVVAIFIAIIIGFAPSVDPTETAVAQQSMLANNVEIGAALFVAKGCITCHRHDDVPYNDIQTEIGPNLTHYQASPEFIRQWLHDPAAIKPQTLMPNLELTDDEIEALIAFVNTEAKLQPEEKQK